MNSSYRVLVGNYVTNEDLCYRIAAVFGGTPDIWANLQTKYNLRSIADKVKSLKLTPYHPHATA